MYKHLLKNKKAVVFDLDGTLIDSEPLWKDAVEAVLANFDADWIDYNEFPTGIPINIRWDLILRKYPEYIDTKMTTRDLEEATYTQYLNKVQETGLNVRNGFWPLAYELKEQKKLKLGLATNTKRKITDVVLDVIVCGDEIKKPKPNGEIYTTVAQKLGVKPEEVLVFEDSSIGAAAANNAKMDLVIIWDGEENKLYYPEKASLFIPDFNGLSGQLDTDAGEDIKLAAEEILRSRSQKPEEQTPTNIA